MGSFALILYSILGRSCMNIISIVLSAAQQMVHDHRVLALAHSVTCRAEPGSGHFGLAGAGRHKLGSQGDDARCCAATTTAAASNGGHQGMANIGRHALRRH